MRAARRTKFQNDWGRRNLKQLFDLCLDELLICARGEPHHPLNSEIGDLLCVRNEPRDLVLMKCLEQFCRMFKGASFALLITYLELPVVSSDVKDDARLISSHKNVIGESLNQGLMARYCVEIVDDACPDNHKSSLDHYVAKKCIFVGVPQVMLAAIKKWNEWKTFPVAVDSSEGPKMVMAEMSSLLWLFVDISNINDLPWIASSWLASQGPGLVFESDQICPVLVAAFRFDEMDKVFDVQTPPTWDVNFFALSAAISTLVQDENLGVRVAHLFHFQIMYRTYNLDFTLLF